MTIMNISSEQPMLWSTSNSFVSDIFTSNPFIGKDLAGIFRYWHDSKRPWGEGVDCFVVAMELRERRLEHSRISNCDPKLAFGELGGHNRSVRLISSARPPSCCCCTMDLHSTYGTGAPPAPAPAKGRSNCSESRWCVSPRRCSRFFDKPRPAISATADCFCPLPSEKWLRRTSFGRTTRRLRRHDTQTQSTGRWRCQTFPPGDPEACERSASCRSSRQLRCGLARSGPAPDESRRAWNSCLL